MTFVHNINIRTQAPMWSDWRMVNVATDFCLCAKCAKHGHQGEGCKIHGRFIDVTTKEIVVAAPILGCVEFVEDSNKPNLLDKYFDTDSELLSTEKVKIR